jgi:hypothetical protein
MLLFQLGVAAVQFTVAQLVQSEIGVKGLLLLALAAVGVRARNAPLALSAAVFFILLMVHR